MSIPLFYFFEKILILREKSHALRWYAGTKGVECMSDPAIRDASGRDSKGKFVKGRSGNPSGRPKMTSEQSDALDIIRLSAPEAVQTALKMMRDPDTDDMVRYRIVEMILNRTYGKDAFAGSVDGLTVRVVIDGDGDSPGDLSC